MSQNTRSKTAATATEGCSKRPATQAPTAIGKQLQEVEPAPHSFEEARKAAHWNLLKQAIEAGYKGLASSGTFGEPVQLENRKPIGSKWVFRWKTDAAGKIIKPKARLVAKGFSQKLGIDYDETFAPTPHASSIRLLLATAVQEDLDILHFDAEQAFIESKLEENIYMRLPPGCGSTSGKTVKLHRSLYGLKQAGRCWNYPLVEKLTQFSFERSLADSCIFRVRKGSKVTMMLAVHVDDMIVAGTEDDCKALHKFLNENFPKNNLGELTHYMGCSFARNRKEGTLTMSQESSIEKLTERFHVTKTNPIPACPSVELDARREGEAKTEEPYREAVGGLLWVAGMTRPDIAQAVRSVARHSHNPCQRH